MRSPRHHSRCSRPANLATTASVLVALVAVAAAMGPLPKAPHHRAPSHEARLSVSHSESHMIRAVAQAVAAVARELVGAERITPDAALPADPFACITLLTPSIHLTHPFDDVGQIPVQLLMDERLLDLPPPVC